MDTPVNEFYAPRAARDLGDPALDPPMTVRVHRGEDRAVRYSPDALRAVKTSERQNSSPRGPRVSGSPSFGHATTGAGGTSSRRMASSCSHEPVCSGITRSG